MSRLLAGGSKRHSYLVCGGDAPRFTMHVNHSDRGVIQTLVCTESARTVHCTVSTKDTCDRYVHRNLWKENVSQLGKITQNKADPGVNTPAKSGIVLTPMIRFMPPRASHGVLRTRCATQCVSSNPPFAKCTLEEADGTTHPFVWHPAYGRRTKERRGNKYLDLLV